MTQDALNYLKRIYVENKLSKDDVFTKTFKDGSKYVIITRSGIEKIIGNHNITMKYEAEHISPQLCVVKAIACIDPCGTSIQTFGSACPENSTSPYLMEMAEKRAMARATLKLLRLYEQGIFGEDESTEFQRENTDGRLDLA